MMNILNIEQRHLVDRRLTHERRTVDDRRGSVESVKEERAGRPVKVLDIVGSILAVITGIIIIAATGLYGTASSFLVSAGITAAFVYVYVTVFRRALHSR
jgi:hypothetical protein